MHAGRVHGASWEGAQSEPLLLACCPPAAPWQSATEHARLALYTLAEVYRAARALFPLSTEPDEAGRSVTVRSLP